MMDAVHHYGGYVAQSTGDGIFALFGAPTAHEDHPQRALYAALKMQQEMRRYSAKLRATGNLPLEARVGVNTGEVVVRSIATGEDHAEYTPIGHSTSLAARMQALAPTGSVATTDTTRKFCEGYFTFKTLGPTAVKGVGGQVEVYEVTGLGPLRTRLHRAAARGLTKFVGREREMEALKHAADLAKAGRGQVVAAIAEAGVGKSRLLYEFKVISQSEWMVLEAFSVSHGKANAYFPVIDLLHGYFRIIGDDDERSRRAKIIGTVLELDRALEDILPYLFALLGIVEDHDPLAQMDGQIKKRRTLEAIKRIILRESLNQPLLVIFEDLHWIDEQTQEFLNMLAEATANSKILLLVSYRPEYSHQWGSRTYYTQLRLDPLGKERADEMLSALLGHGEDLTPLKRLIIERTEGTPFFMEETVQVLLDEGALVRNGGTHLTKPLEQLKIPPTVQAILAARIDRLPGDEKGLLQALAVIGKQFLRALVQAVAESDQASGFVQSGKRSTSIDASDSTDHLDAMLEHLQLAEFIYEQPAIGGVEYSFKHALTLEVAYASILSERRRLLHGLIAESIEALHKGVLDDHVEQLAHHYENSANTVKAVDYLRQAGDQAVNRASYTQALGRFNRALKLLEKLPENAEREVRELALRNAISPVLIATKGFAAAELEHNQVRAQSLAERVGAPPDLLRAIQGLYIFYASRGRFNDARTLAEKSVALAEAAANPVLLSGAQIILGQTLGWTGNLVDAGVHLKLARKQYDPSRSSPEWTQLQLFALSEGASNLCCLGYPDQARDMANEVLTLASGQSDPFGLAIGFDTICYTHCLQRNYLALREPAARLEVTSTESGFPSYLALARMYKGVTLADGGEPREGIECLVRGLADYRAIGTQLSVPVFLSMLAEAHAKDGDRAKASTVLQEAFDVAAKTGERQLQSELHRIRGGLLLETNSADAQAEVTTAIKIAAEQGARLFELRATTSLARLLASQGRRPEARTMLADIYNWFTEGFDTVDLKEAKALLDELSS
jgi:tetratricopeptide (TPR) repeat protein